ncbi:branched-chain amino acid ABC transporter permease [Geodermatophilus sp. SYSU D00815]
MSDLNTSAPAAGQATSAAPVVATAAADVPSATTGGRRRGRVRLPQAALPRHALLVLLAAVAGIVLIEVVDRFTHTQIASVGYYAVAAAGLTVLTGLNGQISLGHGALMAVGAYVTALFLERQEDPWPLPLVFLVAVVATTVVGAVVGVAAARLHGPYLAGATLALAVGLPGLALVFPETLGGNQPITFRRPEPPVWWQDASFFLSGQQPTNQKWQAYLGLFCVLLTFFLLANLARSRVGRTWRAVRDQEVAAELAGIRLGAWRVLAFVVSSACAGLAGALLAFVLGSVSTLSFTIVLSLGLLTAIVIGGLGSLLGALLGALMLVFLPELARDAGASFDLGDAEAAQLAPFVYGVVLVLVMLFAPAGLVGTIRLRWLARRAKRARARAGGG